MIYKNVDNEEKQIFLKKRNISIESDLLFPPDYKIYIIDSTTINLKKSSEIFESPFHMCR